MAKLRIGCYILTAVIACLYWAALFTEQRLAARDAPSLIVFPVNGLRIDLDSGSFFGGPGHPPRRSTPGRTLLLVSADTCQLARKVAPLWGELIASLPFAPEDRVVVVSLRGNEIPQLLSKSARERLVAFRPVTVTDLTAFTLSTGIQATPGTFALDQDLRVRWIILPNRLHESRGLLAAFFRREED
jgi:hypothetical protein